ncbi:MAG: family 16 glycosylhydrolase [Clostridiaceae bacterium]|nr:family 16 glycosylhydrolase [Clostridiaceae bacterium]
MKRNKLKIVTLSLLVVSVLLSTTFMSKGVSAVATAHLGEGFDSFNTATWAKSDGWTNGGMFNCTWRANNVNFSNGLMTLTLNNDTQGGTKPYATGEYRSNDTYGYGLFQTNMKPAKNSGIVSSFFTYTGPGDNTPWDEIDIEFLGKDTTKVQFNYFTNGVGNHEYLYNLGFDASTSFHTYAFNWQPTYIAWLVDGKEVYRATSSIPSHPGKIMMNLWPGTGVDGWLGAFNGATPIYAYYDWVSYDPTTTATATNLALNKTATESSEEAAANAAKYAFDGNSGTRWSSQFSDAQWLAVDLGAAKTVSRVKLNWEAAYGKGYKIQVSSNGTTWTDVYTTTTSDGGIDDISFNSVSTRYVRMYGTQRSTVYGYSLWDFEVY